MREPLSEKEICESDLTKKWEESKCIKKSFSELYALDGQTRKILEMVTGSNDEESLSSSLSSMEEINISGSGIDDLNILAYEGITPTKIDIRENRIKDLSPLMHNERLRTLYATDNYLSMIQTVPKNLEKFGAARNRIRNIEGLSGAINLKTVTLKNNLIRDLGPLANAKDLEELYLDNNQIEKIDVLKNLEKLHRLWISSNPIEDFKPLQGLVSITKLRMQKVGIKCLEPLREMKKMEILNLTGNPDITDLSPIASMSELHTLWLWGSKKIQNLSIISEFPKMKELRLNDMDIEDLGFLSPLSSLRVLEAEDNSIRSLAPIANLTLDSIRLKGNSIDTDQNLYLDENKCPINSGGAIGKYCRLKRGITD